MNRTTDKDISRLVVDSALEVQRALGGPGSLESVYEEALAEELTSRGVTVRRQVPVPIVYRGRQLTLALRLDLLVEERVIVECKAVAKLNDVSANQTLTSLRCSDRRLGLIINFGQRPLRHCIRRVVNGLDE